MRTTSLLMAVLGVALSACARDPDPALADATTDGEAVDGTSGGSTGGSTGGGAGESSDTVEEGDTGAETTTGAEPNDPDDAEPIEVLNPVAVASAMNGDSLTIVDYVAAADGVLVVRGGAAGPIVESVTFGGEPLASIASHEEPDYWFAISADMYWMPVTAGQTGDIVWQYAPGDWTTRRRGAIAVTVSGVDQVDAVAMSSDGLGTNEGRTGPAATELELTTTRDAVILSSFTSNGPGPSELTGGGHTMDGFPTVPIEEFHSTRLYGGHVRAGVGSFTVGYANNEPGGWFDYILLVAAFSSSG